MPDPLIVQLTRQFQNDLDQQANAATEEMARRWLGVEQSLEQQVSALTRQIYDMRQAGQVVTQARLARLDHYTSLISQVQQQIERFNGVAATDINRLTQQAAQSGIVNAGQLINTAATGNPFINFAFNRLGIEAVQNITAIARAGQPLNRILAAAYPATVNSITDVLLYGAAVGWNPRQTANTVINRGLATGLNHVLLVTRDQQVRSYREGARQQYQKSGVVTSYVRLAARQKRTCVACLALSGTEYDTNEVMHLHPQDRCTMLPKVKGFSLPQVESGEAWFNRQPESVQREMLGPGRFQGYQDGRFEFNQLATSRGNDTWGPSAQPTSLRDLRAGRGGITPSVIRANYTDEYWEYRDRVAQIEADGEFYEGELQEARDAFFSEQTASEWARLRGYAPGAMRAADWRRLAGELQEDALENLRLAREEDRIAAGNVAAGRSFIGGQVGRQREYIQVGGQTIERQWAGGSRAAAARETAAINRRTQEAASDWMTGQLVNFGYSRGRVSGLSYEQKRRLLAEIGHGELQTQAIAGVPRDERARIVGSADDRTRRNARQIVLNPRAGEGLDQWFGYELSMIHAGEEDNIGTLPDFRENRLPDYVLKAGSGKKKEKPIEPPLVAVDEIDF